MTSSKLNEDTVSRWMSSVTASWKVCEKCFQAWNSNRRMRIWGLSACRMMVCTRESWMEGTFWSMIWIQWSEYTWSCVWKRNTGGPSSRIWRDATTSVERFRIDIHLSHWWLKEEPSELRRRVEKRRFRQMERNGRETRENIFRELRSFSKHSKMRVSTSVGKSFMVRVGRMASGRSWPGRARRCYTESLFLQKVWHLPWVRSCKGGLYVRSPIMQVPTDNDSNKFVIIL